MSDTLAIVFAMVLGGAFGVLVVGLLVRKWLRPVKAIRDRNENGVD